MCIYICILAHIDMKINGARKDVNGWIYISIHGEPYERGYAHGHLVARELAQIMEMLEFTAYERLWTDICIFV